MEKCLNIFKLKVNFSSLKYLNRIKYRKRFQIKYTNVFIVFYLSITERSLLRREDNESHALRESIGESFAGEDDNDGAA